jgi:hypothetical protein
MRAARQADVKKPRRARLLRLLNRVAKPEPASLQAAPSYNINAAEYTPAAAQRADCHADGAGRVALGYPYPPLA